MKPIHLVKLSLPFAIAFCLLVAWLAILTAVDVTPQALAQEPLPPPEAGESGYRLNSEGDEWVLVDPDQIELAPPAPPVVFQDEEAGDGTELAPVYLPPDDSALGLALDRARDAGPEGVLAFVAAQPDPSNLLLQAAAEDAQQELEAGGSGPSTDAILAPSVAINSGPCLYETIQAAVNAAPSGSILRVAAGTYLEVIDVTAKTLVIEGGYDGTCTTLDPNAITQVDASGLVGSVVDVSSAAVVTLRNLRLTGGTSFGAGVDLVGVSRVTLDHTHIFGNNGASGAGLYIGGTSVLTYTNDTNIYNNVSTGDGGGAIVYGRLVGFESNSDIYSNSAVNGGGIAVNGGTVELDNSDVAANTATSLGGGIYAIDGLVTLSNSVFVGETAPCCQSAQAGGGIYASGGRVILLGAGTTVMNNTATGNGGGIYLTNGATLDVTGSRLGYDNTSVSGNDAVLGAGMYLITSTVNFEGRIVNNIATNSGAGVYADNSTLTVTNTTIGGTGAYQHNQIGASGLNGAGMYLIDNSRAVINDSSIISNTLSNAATGYGGGLYVRAGSAITVTNSSIQEHYLPSAFDGRGAGMYLYDAAVTLSNTQVISNTTANLGAGARMFGTSTLNVLGGSSLVNNKALGGVGGAVAATNTATINVRDATIQYNTASGSGGAFYLDAGSLDFDGWWDVRWNQAGANGGAVALSGTGEADFAVTSRDRLSYLAVNSAIGNGGAVFLNNTDSVSLHAISGNRLNLNTNSTGGHGGALYANAAGFFDIYGDIQATSNNAGGNGGFAYLEGGARLWMDDYFTTRPQVLVNWADNGGAIYAQDSPRVELDGVDFGFSDNGNQAIAGSGGAIYLSNSTLDADNCTFRDSQATLDGGALAAYNSTVSIYATYPPVTPRSQPPESERSTLSTLSPLSVTASSCDPLAGQCSSLYSNTADSDDDLSGYGGAIYSNGSSLTIDKTYLHNNTAQRGGAIYQEGAAATGVISTTLIHSNTSLEAFGAGIRAQGGAMTIRDSTLANNIGGAGYSPGAVLSYLYNTIIWGNSTAAFGALTEAMCNIDQGGTAGTAIDPLFVDPGAADYHLRVSSPALDACASGLATDLDGFPRPTLALWDMGAFEYQPAATTTTITSDAPDPSLAGEPFVVSFWVTSAVGIPSGIVTVTVSGNPATCSAPLVGGLGSCELILATPGEYTLTAEYGGAVHFLASSDSEMHTVPAPTTTTITSDDPDPSQAGEAFVVEFEVASTHGTAAGEVTISVSGSPVTCSATLVNGTGSCELTLATPGSYTLVADYGGAALFLASSDSETHSVVPVTQWLYLPAVLKAP